MDYDGGVVDFAIDSVPVGEATLTYVEVEAPSVSILTNVVSVYTKELGLEKPTSETTKQLVKRYKEKDY